MNENIFLESKIFKEMDWKLIVFDFDDTIYLKTQYDMIPYIYDVLFMIKKKNIPIVILTYNNRVFAILKHYELEKQFDFVIVIDSKFKNKSDIFKTHICFKGVKKKEEILFFDNDPYNIYDLSRLGISCFLINPVNGLKKEMIEDLLHCNFNKMRKNLLETLPNIYNYVDRTTNTQNLEQIDKLLSSLKS